MKKEANKTTVNTKDGKEITSIELLSTIANLLDCFVTREGTWHQDHWSDFGISQEIAELIETAYNEKQTH